MSKRYADHGPKLLRYSCGQPGRPLIIREEMLASTPGFADHSKPAPPSVVDLTAMVPPIKVSWRLERTTDARAGLLLISIIVTDKKKAVRIVSLGSTDSNEHPLDGDAPQDMGGVVLSQLGYADGDFNEWYAIVSDPAGLHVQRLVIPEGEDNVENRALVQIRLRRRADVTYDPE
jgi:hypothetical protein